MTRPGCIRDGHDVQAAGFVVNIRGGSQKAGNGYALAFIEQSGQTDEDDEGP